MQLRCRVVERVGLVRVEMIEIRGASPKCLSSYERASARVSVAECGHRRPGVEILRKS